MEKVWNELLHFETRDLVERFIRERHGRSINAHRILQITSNFVQGREYFTSAKKASITVRPLLQYYGVMALSKGLILSLDLAKTEDQLKSSHGLEVKNWKGVLKNKDFENLSISIREGTFSELLSATDNKSYLSSNSSGINWVFYLNTPIHGSEFTFKQVVQYFPNVDKEYESWISEKLLFACINEFKKEGNEALVKLNGIIDEAAVNLLFPNDYCHSKTVERINHSTLVKYSNPNWFFNVTQEWGEVLNIGNSCVIPAIRNDIGLNLLGAMYIISYVLGMMARYFPTTWISLKRVEKGDKIYPLIHRILDLVYDKYPKQVLDFLNSPYDFESG